MNVSLYARTPVNKIKYNLKKGGCQNTTDLFLKKPLTLNNKKLRTDHFWKVIIN